MEYRNSLWFAQSETTDEECVMTTCSEIGCYDLCVTGDTGMDEHKMCALHLMTSVAALLEVSERDRELGRWPKTEV